MDKREKEGAKITLSYSRKDQTISIGNGESEISFSTEDAVLLGGLLSRFSGTHFENEKMLGLRRRGMSKNDD